MIQLQEQDTCQYCEKDDVLCCEVQNYEYGYACTRSIGHEGAHVACGFKDGHVLAMWPQEIEDNA